MVMIGICQLECFRQAIGSGDILILSVRFTQQIESYDVLNTTYDIPDVTEDAAPPISLL